MSSVHRLQVGNIDVIIRSNDQERSHLKREVFVAHFFSEHLGIKTSSPVLGEGENARKIRRKILNDFDDNSVTVAQYIQDSLVGEEFLAKFDFEKPHSLSDVTAGFSPKILNQLGEYLAGCLLFMIPDCHKQNWVMRGDDLYAIDLAYPFLSSLNPNAPHNFFMVGFDFPLMTTYATKEHLQWYLSFVSKEFIENLEKLTKDNVQKIAEQLQYSLHQDEVSYIMKNREHLLEMLNKRR
jgi:hypothetical protein